MPNPYHLVIQTPEANLSKAMRQILEKYSPISSIIERMKKQIRENPKHKKKIEKLTQK